jgi:hypothetical protein
MKILRTIAYLFAVPFLFIAALVECDCSGGLTATQANALVVGINDTVCILDHASDPPATIAQECLDDPTNISAVVQILSAHYAAESREHTGSADAGGQ